MLEAFDEEKWLRDGYYVWPGIMTPECRRLWSEALRECQAIQDYAIFNTDWNNMDWAAHGLPPLKRTLTDEDLHTWAGTSEATVRGFPDGYGRGLRHHLPLAMPEGVENQGFFPEHFAQAYSPFLMEVTTQHPQMLQMQRMLHGDAGPLRVDHCIMLNRKAGATGRTWHSHLYGPGDTETHDVTEGSGLFLVRSLCFPDGVTPGRDDRSPTPEDAPEDASLGGMVGMIPGSHTYRDPWPGPRLHVAGPPDTGMRESWMAGKVNPATGEPLEIVYPPLPPGSILSFVHWMPHGVTLIEKGTRWGILLTYRTMDPNRRIMAAPQIPWAVRCFPVQPWAALTTPACAAVVRGPSPAARTPRLPDPGTVRLAGGHAGKHGDGLGRPERAESDVLTRVNTRL